MNYEKNLNDLAARVERLEREREEAAARLAAEADRASRQELRDSFRAQRHCLDLRNADPDDLWRWSRDVDRATRGRRAA
jgi:hypothetical protein